MGFRLLKLFAIFGLSALAACQTPSGTNPDRLHGAFFTANGSNGGTYGDFAADLNAAIPDPAAVTLVLFNHGTSAGGLDQKCRPQKALPRFFAAMAENLPEAVIYYPCSDVLGGNAGASQSRQIYQLRGEEIAALLDRFIAHGVAPRRIVLVGHSGGASAVMVAAAEAAGKFAAFVASAPGHGYAYLGRDAGNNPLLSGQIYGWQQALEEAAGPGLVFAYQGDRFSPPGDLEFLADREGVELVNVENARCGRVAPHGFLWSPCFAKRYGRMVLNFVARHGGLNLPAGATDTIVAAAAVRAKTDTKPDPELAGRLLSQLGKAGFKVPKSLRRQLPRYLELRAHKALAISRSGAWASATNRLSRKIANNDARQRCAKLGPKCRLALAGEEIVGDGE
ncbi:MAG: hypothetical protein CMM08_17395 [Rhodospirillaceae bacterium]|jgi:pimeloyl-ACP methyl ester carboxylesterase|nr:hypothetical protein [Rhodospirillaceae bacterium]|tara:strand:+ start:722 stop:1903 length:1182 start_codon:yes stop_codon:yes gene_type:complete